MITCSIKSAYLQRLRYHHYYSSIYLLFSAPCFYIVCSRFVAVLFVRTAFFSTARDIIINRKLIEIMIFAEWSPHSSKHILLGESVMNWKKENRGK